MRLLNVHSFELSEFIGEEHTPRYAILSHTWSNEEVNYAEFDQRVSEHKEGWAKIVSFCQLAASRNIDYAWIDTCCVDKRSSAELSETINSIFRWYAQAAECYALLSDVTSVGPQRNQWEHKFEQSRWFTRGWTLPELLAPKTVIFVDNCWQIIGYKAPPTETALVERVLDGSSIRYPLNLTERIEAITGIPRRFLEGESLSEASVDDRIDWARNRKTTRVEDMAYCLLGILGLSMDLRYGEGTRAFVRLRDEIIRWENEDLFVPVSSGFEALEILRLPRHRGKQVRVQSPPRSVEEMSARSIRRKKGSEEGIEPQSMTRSSHIPTDQGGVSPAQASFQSQRDSGSTPVNPRKATIRFSLSKCWIIIILGSVIIAGSFAVGLFYSIAKDQMGAGFTVAGWIIAVGTLALAVPMTLHYPRCKCWKKTADSILGSP